MRGLWISAALAFLIDQGSKVWLFQGLDLMNQGRIDVFPPLLVFKPGINTGINFGFLGDIPAWVLIALAVLISAGLVIWAVRTFAKPIEFISAGLVVGGALGNALDRLIHPGVLDFLNMSCCGIQNPFVFNLADVFIFAGAFGLAFFAGPSGNTPTQQKNGG